LRECLSGNPGERDAHDAVMSEAQEPLIAGPERVDAEAGNDSFADNGDHHSDLGKPSDDSSAGLFIWLLAFSAGISGLLFGCECLLWTYRSVGHGLWD
jgi:hypothetical protein